MALSFSAPLVVHLDLSRPFHWMAAFIARRRARRVEAEAIQHLRQYDRHLLADLNLDEEALWRLHPSICLLDAPDLTTGILAEPLPLAEPASGSVRSAVQDYPPLARRELHRV